MQQPLTVKKYGQFSGVFLSKNLGQCESNLSLSNSQQGAPPLVSIRNLMYLNYFISHLIYYFRKQHHESL